MKYPVPSQNIIFEFQEKLNTKNNTNKNVSKKYKLNNNFSRETKNKFMDKFITKINKNWSLYKSLPFVEEIYLCNSITFNALKRDSDIDLFIIAKKWHIRRARLFSAILFKLKWLKRSIRNKKQKFCLSFYITQDNKNLYPIMIDKTDIYLSYRLAHLTPLYRQNNTKHSKDHNIYQNNKRLKSLMPNHPQEHCINIWNKLFTWKTKTKKRLEFWFWWIIWYLIELIIKTIRIPILLHKIKKLWPKWKAIIISDKILKFHDDIRKQIQLLYEISKKN